MSDVTHTATLSPDFTVGVGVMPAKPYAGNTTCVHCGGPAHESFVTVECMRAGGCGVPEEPMPERSP